MSKGWKAFFAAVAVFFTVLIARDLMLWSQRPDGIELVVWDLPVEGRTDDRQLWLNAANSFEKSYGHSVRVKAIARRYVQQQFTAVMASGKGPDVALVPVSALPMLSRHGFLAPLETEIKYWQFSSSVPPLQWEPATLEGKRYGVPYDSYFLTLLIRKDLYQAAGLNVMHPPSTWTELADAARKMSRPEIDQYGLGFSPTTDQFMDFVWQAGGRLVEWDGQKYRSAFHQNAGITALTYLRGLRFEKGVMQANPLASKDELAQLFALGQVGMILGVANQMPDLISRYGMDPNNLMIAPLPAGPSGIRASHSGGDYFVINANADSQKRHAAWAYIEHILSPLNQLAKWKAMNDKRMPVYPGAFSVTANLHNHPDFRLIKDALEYSRVEPHPKDWPLIKDQLDSLVLQRVFLDPDVNVEDALAEAAWEIDERFF